MNKVKANYFQSIILRMDINETWEYMNQFNNEFTIGPPQTSNMVEPSPTVVDSSTLNHGQFIALEEAMKVLGEGDKESAQHMLKKAGIALYEDEKDNKSEDGDGSPAATAQSSVKYNTTESREITSQECSTSLKDK